MRFFYGVALLVVLVLAGCGTPRDERPSSTGGAAVAPRPTGRLAYVAEDNHIYTIAVEGGDPRRVDTIPGEQAVAGEARISRWPTWTGDGAVLAFMRLRSGEGDAPPSAAIWTVAPDGSNPRKIWESGELAPIYMAWSPDASALSVLAQRRGGFDLLLIDPAGGSSARKVAEGAPLYFAWSPNSAELLVHSGGDRRKNAAAALATVRPGAVDELRPFPLSPADFRAPAWSPDGTRVALVAEAPGSAAVLTVASGQGSEPLRIAPFDEEAAFVWAPGGDMLAFSAKMPPERVFYQGLEVIKSDGSGRAQVTQEPVMAFFWSPDGTKLAYAGVDRRAQALAWFVSDASGKNARQVAQFVPSDEQIRQFAFFDQYAQSHGLWSPDSRFLTYAGSPPPSGAEPKGPRRSRIFIVPADGGAEPKGIVDGMLAVWPTRSK